MLHLPTVTGGRERELMQHWGACVNNNKKGGGRRRARRRGPTVDVVANERVKYAPVGIIATARREGIGCLVGAREGTIRAATTTG